MTAMSLERRLERIALFFRLPYWPYDPEAEVAREGVGRWKRLILSTWLMMAASLVSTWVISGNLLITLELGVLLIAALPMAYRLHFRRTSRLLVNWLTFSCAFLMGFLQLRLLWPFSHGIWAAENVESMAFLVICFMWITAFRAFALRTCRDLVETILPCGSIILLTLVIRPMALSLAATALMVLGALALLAAQHSITAAAARQPLQRVTVTHSNRRAGAFYSWPTLYALVLLTSVLIAYAAARSELSGGWGDYLRGALARQVYRFIPTRDQYVLLPDASVSLARLNAWPDSETPVFRVHTTVPGNYRIGVYHTYTGIWWRTDNRRQKKATPEGRKFLIPLAGYGAARQKGNRVEQNFTAQKGFVGTLPSLFSPVSVEVNQRLVRYDRDLNLRIPHFVRRGESFKVISYLQPVIPVKRPGTEVTAEVLARDLQLPDTLPQRVRDLAREITKDQTTAYNKAHAIEQYLMWNHRYTLSAPSGYPEDFVDYFLFTSKRGFCHHFAGSMVIMCRSLGLPTRLASGFTRGEDVQDVPDTYIVREKDAHVWPEVYFPGAGWVQFEPTPPAEEQEGAFAAVWKQITQGATVYGTRALAFLLRYWPSLLMAVAGLALLLAITLVRRSQRYLRPYRGDDPVSQAIRAYVRMRRMLVEGGAPNDASLAPREFLGALPEELGHVREAAAVLTENYLARRYQRNGDGAGTEAAASFAAFRQALRQRPARKPLPQP